MVVLDVYRHPASMPSARFENVGSRFAGLITFLGFLYIGGALLYFHTDKPANFALYLVTGLTVAVFMQCRGLDQDFSVNLSAGWMIREGLFCLLP